MTAIVNQNYSYFRTQKSNLFYLSKSFYDFSFSISAIAAAGARTFPSWMK
jgi:hypothetical protein